MGACARVDVCGRCGRKGVDGNGWGGGPERAGVSASEWMAMCVARGKKSNLCD